MGSRVTGRTEVGCVEVHRRRGPNGEVERARAPEACVRQARAQAAPRDAGVALAGHSRSAARSRPPRFRGEREEEGSLVPRRVHFVRGEGRGVST